MKLLFFDIDGTLLSEKTQTVPQSAITAIHQAQRNGHLAFINTGRPLASLDQAIQSLGMDGWVCGCGTYISFHETILKHDTLPQSLCHHLINLLRQYHVSAILEGCQAVYYDPLDHHPQIMSIQAQYAKRGLDVSKTWYDPHISFDKVTCWMTEKSQTEAFLMAIRPFFTAIKRGDRFYELIPKGHSKATGIEYLLDYFALSLEDAYVFGDSTNDLSMFEYVPHSIAMAQSDPAILNRAEWVTQDVDEDGIAYALKYYHLIGEEEIQDV